MTLAQAIQTERVPMATLEDRYKPVLQMVDVLIGVVPNCDLYLEIWPAGFRTYNLMVPNFLNLPNALVGGDLKSVVGLAMYASSRAASCNYCSAHTCSFALRRGSSSGAITGEQRSRLESAAVEVAEALSSDPQYFSTEIGDRLRRECTIEEAEWIVMSIAMMGFLNKFMDAIGVELEAEAVGDVSSLIAPTGWSVGNHSWADERLAETTGSAPAKDSASTIIRVLRNAPGAVRLEREWMDDMPKDGAAARQRLESDYGYDEELLTRMLHTKPRRALAAMLRHNLDSTQSELGIGLKSLASVLFASHMGNEWLLAKSTSLARHHGAPEATIESFAGPVDMTSGTHQLDARTEAVRVAAAAMSPSPAQVVASDIATVTNVLSSQEIIELAVWISVAQLQHRLSLWYGLES